MAVTSSTTDTNNQYSFLNTGSTSTATSATTAASRAAAQAKMNLNAADFLKLMTTQMTHQDPNEPMKNGEFLAEMAQFGTVSGIQDLQTSFADFATSIQSAQSMQAASLVGHYVSVSTDTGVLPAGGSIDGDVNLASSTSDLQYTVTDATTGATIKTVDLGNQSSGNIPFSWDGTNDAGTQVSPGSYKIAATAMVDGKNVVQTTDINSKVESVSMANGTTPMQVNLAGAKSVAFSQVKQII